MSFQLIFVLGITVFYNFKMTHYDGLCERLYSVYLVNVMAGAKNKRQLHLFYTLMYDLLDKCIKKILKTINIHYVYNQQLFILSYIFRVTWARLISET